MTRVIDGIDELKKLVGEQVFGVKAISMGVDDGAERVRFPATVPVGSKVRLGIKILAVDDVPGGAQSTQMFTFEVEGASKPSCVAQAIVRYDV